MRSAHSLRKLFLELSTIAVVGCGGSTAEVDPNPSSDAGTKSDSSSTHVFDQSVCDATSAYAPLQDITTSSGTDSFEYIELRSETDYAGDGAPGVIAKSGTPCQRALDIPACNAKIAATRSKTGFETIPNSGGGDIGPMHNYLLVNKGDDVSVIATIAGLTEYLKPFEVIKDGALLISQRGYFFQCGANNAKQVEGGAFEYEAYSGFACGEGTHRDRHLIRVSESGELTVLETTVVQVGAAGCVSGRRPEGFNLELARTRSIGEYFAESALLEAASVPAFRRLAAELKMMKAPRALVRRALTAANDEVRHARVTARLAKKNGGRLRKLGKVDVTERSIAKVALENAVEGCVRETFGALVMTRQAALAKDAGLRKTFATIAIDETNHAALAWDVAKWCEKKLSKAELGQVEKARGQAISELREELLNSVFGAGDAALGLPNPAESVALLDALTARLAA